MEVNILVAEDDAVTRENIVNDLRELGFSGEIVQAEDGKKAFMALSEAHAKGLNINLIISDMVMPNATGFDFLKLLKDNDSFKSIPFMMLTSRNDKEIIIQCAKAGVTSYMIKPWTKQGLAEKISKCLTGK